MKLQRKHLPVSLVTAGSLCALVGIWLLGGLPLTLAAVGAAAVTLGLLVEV